MTSTPSFFINTVARKQTKQNALKGNSDLFKKRINSGLFEQNTRVAVETKVNQLKNSCR